LYNPFRTPSLRLTHLLASLILIEEAETSCDISKHASTHSVLSIIITPPHFVELAFPIRSGKLNHMTSLSHKWCLHRVVDTNKIDSHHDWRHHDWRHEFHHSDSLMSNGIGKISKKVLKSQVYTEFLYSSNDSSEQNKRRKQHMSKRESLSRTVRVTVVIGIVLGFRFVIIGVLTNFELEVDGDVLWTLEFFAERSFDDEFERAIVKDIPLVPMIFVIMSIFT